MKPRNEQRITSGSARKWLLVGTLAMVTLLPSAWADSGAGTGDRATDMVLDLFILRPIGLVATTIGSAAFILALPFTLPSGSVGDTACELVQQPFAYTFSRPLGDMTSGNDGCNAGAER